MKKYCFTQYFFSLKVSERRRLIFPNEGYVKVHFHNFRVTEIYETREASALTDINTNMKERCFTRRSFNLNFQKKKPRSEQGLFIYVMC